MARSSSASRACVLFRQTPVKKDASSATSWEVMYAAGVPGLAGRMFRSSQQKTAM